MKTRPKSITFISWFLIITSVISIISTAFTYDTPEMVKIMELSPIPIILQYIMMVVGMTITISCSVLMLKAKSIGRIVYVGWTTLSHHWIIYVSCSIYDASRCTLLCCGYFLFI